MDIDLGNILAGIELAVWVTAGLVLFMVFLVWAAQPRLRKRWRWSEPARISLDCADARQLTAYIERTLAPYGFRATDTPNGQLIFQASAFRQRLGASPITVSFPANGMAIVAGQALFVAKLSPDGMVTFVEEGSVPFRDWVWQRLAAKFAWIAGFTFVAIFLLRWSW
jgi:hypothetical protein